MILTSAVRKLIQLNFELWSVYQTFFYRIACDNEFRQKLSYRSLYRLQFRILQRYTDRYWKFKNLIRVSEGIGELRPIIHAVIKLRATLTDPFLDVIYKYCSYMYRMKYVSLQEAFQDCIDSFFREDPGADDSFHPAGIPLPGYVVKADEFGNPVWGEDEGGVNPEGEPEPGDVIKINNEGIAVWGKDRVGLEPIGTPKEGLIVKVNEEGIAEWLPESSAESESALIIDRLSPKHEGYVLMITGTKDDKMTCKWVNVNNLVFENPDQSKEI